MPQVPKPHTIAWPLTPKSAEDIDQNFDALFRQVQLNASSGVLPVSLGGTGLPSFVTGDLLYATSPSTLAGLHDIATGNALLSGGVGVKPLYGKVGLTTHVSGILPEANGGTNQSTYAQGDLIYASAANTLAKLAKDANATRYLSNTGASNAPTWAQVNLANGVTGTLPVANGGTAIASYTSGDLIYATGATTLAKLGIGAANRVLRSDGSAPNWGQVTNAFIVDVAEDKITDGTILARVASDETITGSWTFESAAPLIKFLETDAAANAQKWRINVDGGQLALQVLSDNELTANSALIVARSGSTISSVTAAFPWTFSGAGTSSGGWTFSSTVVMNNNVPINTKNAAATAVLLVSLDSNDDYTFGQATASTTRNTRISAGNQVQLFTNSAQRTTVDNAGTLSQAGSVLPTADNTYNCGNATNRWALVRGVTITPGDLLFENGWVITEADKYGFATDGLLVLDENDDIVIFIQEGGTVYGTFLPLVTLPAHTKTTLFDRTGHNRP